MRYVQTQKVMSVMGRSRLERTFVGVWEFTSKPSSASYSAFLGCYRWTHAKMPTKFPLSCYSTTTLPHLNIWDKSGSAHPCHAMVGLYRGMMAKFTNFSTPRAL